MRSVPDTAAVPRQFPGSTSSCSCARASGSPRTTTTCCRHRLAVVSLSGPDRESLIDRFQQAVELLPFDLAPVPARVAG